MLKITCVLFFEDGVSTATTDIRLMTSNVNHRVYNKLATPQQIETIDPTIFV
jgi:hypothetical protein